MCLATMVYVYASCAVHVTIFSNGGKFHPVWNFMELHALTQVARSYALLYKAIKANIRLVPGLLHFYSLVQWRSQVTDDTRAQHGRTDNWQAKLSALVGHSLQVAGARAQLVGRHWCHLHGKMDQAFPHHFLHTDQNWSVGEPGSEAWVAMPKATWFTIQPADFIGCSDITSPAAARLKLISVAARLRLNLNRGLGMRLAKNYTYFHVCWQQRYCTSWHHRKIMFAENRGIPSTAETECNIFATASFIFTSMFVFPYSVEQLVASEVAMVTN